MILNITEVQPEDMRHLFCTDPRLRDEIARLRGSARGSVKPAAAGSSAERRKPVTIPRPRPAA